MSKFFSLILSICFVLLSLSVASQTMTIKDKKAISYYRQAVNLYMAHQYNESLENVEKALERDDNFLEANLLMAELKRLDEDYDKEVICYKKVIAINPDFFPYTYLNLAFAEMHSGKYSDAITSADRFLTLPKVKQSSRDKAIALKKKCNFAVELMKNPVEFVPNDLGEGINNQWDQYWPSLSIDGKIMVYTVLKTDSILRNAIGDFKYQEDFYISTFENDNWMTGVPIGGPVNTKGNEGAQQLSADGTTLVFTGCNRSDGKGRCDIYFSYKTLTGWTKPVNAGLPLNTEYSEKQPCLSPDGRVLYFSSNRTGGMGGMDLWRSIKDEKGNWSKAKNMGDVINSHLDDVSPYIHPDNQTLYFSSEGHLGLGKKDIFYCRVDETNTWSAPKNMGYPINTHGDEIGLVVNKLGNKAYYSTNIGKQSSNIYSFIMPKETRPTPVSYVSGIITDAETKEKLQAKFQLLNPETSDTIMQSYSNSTTGEYLVCLPIGNNYALNVSLLGYLFHSEFFNLSTENSANNPFQLNVALNKIKVGERIVLQNIFFKHNSFELLASSTAEISKVVQFIEQNPSLKIEIGGYTDDTGSTEYNKKLSEKRAGIVYEAILKYGDFSTNIVYKGYGELNPIGSNLSEDGKALNRRTELKVISLD